MTSRLAQAVREIEEHVAAAGWDQPPRLFALVHTAELLAREPGLAAALGASDRDGEPVAELTPVEQEELPDARARSRSCWPGIAWPDEVAGAALVVERLDAAAGPRPTCPTTRRRRSSRAAPSTRSARTSGSRWRCCATASG